MIIRLSLKPVLTLLALSVALGHAAQAAQLGPYVGGFYGVTEKQGDANNYQTFTLEAFFPELGFVPSTHDAVFDKEDQSYGALVGYRIHRNLAIEGNFVMFGESAYRARSEGTVNLFTDIGLESFPLTLDTVVDSELTGLGLYALGIWPLSYRWELYARGGIQFSNIRTDASTVRVAGTERVNRAAASIERESTLDLAAGVGAAMSIFDIYGLRLEYMRVFNAGSDALSRGHADLVSIGFIVAF